VTPVNFYATTVQLQNSQNVSLVLIGVRNTITFTVFNVRSETVAGTGSELPSAFQFPQNNTQTGVGAGYSQPLTGFTSFGANASYSRARANGDSSNDFRSNNGNFGANLSTRFGPKTSGSAGLSYSLFRPAGGDNARSSDTLNIFASISHTF